MNPVPPADPWLERVLPIFNSEEDQSEQDYYRKQNDEHIDYLGSSKELKGTPQPPRVPFEMIISTKVQCEGDPTCLKSYGIYEQVERDVAQQWPEGCFRVDVVASHDIYADKTDLALEAVTYPGLYCAK